MLIVLTLRVTVANKVLSVSAASAVGGGRLRRGGHRGERHGTDVDGRSSCV